MRTPIAALVLALAAAPLGGCCAIARTVCDIPAPETPQRNARDTPLRAVDYIIDAFTRRAPSEIYESLHPAFIEKEGGFSAAQFATAYDRFEPEFRADGARLKKAIRDKPRRKGAEMWVYVHDDEGASVWLVFVNRPGSRVLLDQEFDDEIVDDLPEGGVAAMVAVDGDGLALTRPVGLRGRGGDVDPASVRRVEIYQDWLLYGVAQPRNIRFVDRIVAEMKGAR